jgi:hypothetical protein
MFFKRKPKWMEHKHSGQECHAKELSAFASTKRPVSFTPLRFVLDDNPGRVGVLGYDR